MQGSLAGAYTVLDDESTSPHGAYIAASWTFSVTKAGEVFQHYALDKSPFHAGSKAQNLRLIGVEHEGGAPSNLSEPLTEPQIVASVALSQWIATQGGFALSRDPATRTLYEHRDVSATLCPSGRIPWERYLSPEPPALDINVIGIHTRTQYLGFDSRRQTYEYELGMLNTFNGQPDLGLNVSVEYEGYDRGSGEYRYRLRVLKHWGG
jgi:hypothetical protein